MGAIPPTSGSSWQQPHHEMGSVFSQLKQDLNSYLSDPTEQNYEKLLGDIQELQNKVPFFTGDHEILKLLKGDAEHLHGAIEAIADLEKELKNPNLTSQQKEWLILELKEAKSEKESYGTDMQGLANDLIG